MNKRIFKRTCPLCNMETTANMTFIPQENTDPILFSGKLQYTCENCGKNIALPFYDGPIVFVAYDSDVKKIDDEDMFQNIIECVDFDTVNQFFEWAEILPENEEEAEKVSFQILYFTEDKGLYQYRDNLLFQNYPAFWDIFDLQPDTLVINIEPQMCLAYVRSEDVEIAENRNMEHIKNGEEPDCHPMPVAYLMLDEDEMDEYEPAYELNDMLWDITIGEIVRKYDTDFFSCTISYSDYKVTLEPRKTDNPDIRMKQRRLVDTMYNNLIDELEMYMNEENPICYIRNFE